MSEDIFFPFQENYYFRNSNNKFYLNPDLNFFKVTFIVGKESSNKNEQLQTIAAEIGERQIKLQQESELHYHSCLLYTSRCV